MWLLWLMRFIIGLWVVTNNQVQDSYACGQYPQSISHNSYYNLLEILTHIRHSEKVLIMKRLLLILILTLSLQSWTKADDIRDFQIEEMGIGDSLINFVNKNEIKDKMITNYPGSKKFSRFFKKFSQYDHVQFHFKTEDENFIIQGIEGVIYFKNNLANCLKEQKVVIKDIKESLINSELIDMGQQIHKEKDGSIRSHTYNSYIEFDNGFLDITCTDWSKSYESKNETVTDSLKVSFITKELDSWLQNEAWQ